MSAGICIYATPPRGAQVSGDWDKRNKTRGEWGEHGRSNANGMRAHFIVGLLQEEVMKDTEADRDVVYLSLAGVKQVSYLLANS